MSQCVHSSMRFPCTMLLHYRHTMGSRERAASALLCINGSCKGNVLAAPFMRQKYCVQAAFAIYLGLAAKSALSGSAHGSSST